MTAADYILLYYKYVDLIAHQDEIYEWFRELCSSLRLVGRVRIALDGVNVTVGGPQLAVQQHIKAVQEHPLLGTDIDFKLARSDGPRNEQARRESGFDSLQVSKCQEVVSFGAESLSVTPEELKQASAQHVQAQEWHRLLSAGNNNGSKLVLLDVRNLYETRIGHFQADGVELVDPQLRCFMDLPAWFNQNKKALEGSKVLMYCTGGVRCERASALLRSLGHDDVLQLSGGIQRYIDAFPDGGFFKGKNFVFDERVSVGPSEGTAACVVGRCLLCSASCDDYGQRLRCRACRMLILVCSGCTPQAADALCELCQQRALPKSLQKPRLRILCLHGFRQNSSSLKGRLAGLARRIQHEAELVCMDAPHHLPALYKPQGDGVLAANEAPGVLPGRAKCAWLVEPSYLNEEQLGTNAGWRVAPDTVDADQFKRQTEGWPASLDAIKIMLRGQGPFDGCLGFSQGAAIVAALCSLQQEHQRMQSSSQKWNAMDAQSSQKGSTRESGGSSSEAAVGLLSFKFAILCSGYLSRAPEHDHMRLKCTGHLTLPSLHVYGTKSKDRQICTAENEALAAVFSESGRTVLTHDFGHVIPTDKNFVAQYRRFLQHFM